MHTNIRLFHRFEYKIFTHTQKITFFHLHRGRFTYTSFELVKRVGAHYSHGAVSLPNPGAYRPAG